MYKETTLQELQEIVGEFGGTTTNNLFTEITVGDGVISMEAAAPNTKAIANALKRVQEGSRIGILKLNGTFRLRRCKSE